MPPRSPKTPSPDNICIIDGRRHASRRVCSSEDIELAFKHTGEQTAGILMPTVPCFTVRRAPYSTSVAPVHAVKEEVQVRHGAPLHLAAFHQVWTGCAVCLPPS